MTQVMTGPRAIFRLAGNKIAFASNVSFNENYQLEPINVLDNIATIEHAEVGYAVDMQCQNFRIPQQSVKQLGIMSRLSQVLTQGEMTAEVVDSITGSVILLMTGVKMQARQTSVDARGVMSETWSFVGRASEDEAGP